MKTVGFIGSGKMARALALSFIRKDLCKPDEIICTDVNIGTLGKIGDELGVRTVDKAAAVLNQAQVIFLGFKPQNFPDAILPWQEQIRADHLFVSILAGIRLSQLSEMLGDNVVRVMPNTGCLVGQMAGGYTAHPSVSQHDCGFVQTLLDCAGVAVEVPEEMLDAVTGLAGSGPAFIAWLIQQYTQAGTQAGLPEDIAARLSLQTFLGTAQLLQETGTSPQELIDMVSSPNGTTVAGREVLENSTAGSILQQTVARAMQRSKEMGNPGAG